MTLTGSELAEVVERACGEARAKAREADGLLRQRNDAVSKLNQCSGALVQWQGLDAQRLEIVRKLALVERENDSRLHKYWVVVGVVAGLALGGVIGLGVGQF